MTVRPVLAIVMIATSLGCTADPAAPGTDAGRVTPQALAQDAGSVQRAKRRRDNVIEITHETKTFRADTASSYGLTTHDNGRYSLSFSAGWIGDGEMSIVKLSVADIGVEPAVYTLNDGMAVGVHVDIANIPGFGSRSWRSLDGTVEVQALTRNAEGRFEHARGRFDGRFAEYDPGSRAELAGGEVVALSGTFTFKAD